MSLGPRVAVCTDEDLGEMNFIYCSEIHISEGPRFPLPPLIHKFFHFTRLHPIHVHVNIIRFLLGVCVLNRKYELRLGLEEVLYAYSFKRHNLGRYYLDVDVKSLQLVTNLPTNNKNKPQGNVLMFGAWGCAMDPMLREFPVNMDPNAGLKKGSRPYFVPTLVTWLNGMNLPEIRSLWFAYAGTLGQGKLVDDLSPSQFDSLVKVLSLLSSARDFRHLLMPANLREIFDHPKEFVLPKVPRLNFESLGAPEQRSEFKVVFFPSFRWRLRAEFKRLPRRWLEVTLAMSFRSSLLCLENRF